MSSGDTIVAQSTPYGYSGIGVVRMSGSESTKIFKKISRIKKKLTSRIANKAYIYKKGDKIDEVMVVWYKAPKSYTGEDVIEISCHGNQYIVESIIEECIKGGAVAAGPGEFTKRAFQNGKIDLIQAESIANTISTSSSVGLFNAISGVSGNMSKSIRETKNKIIKLLSYCEHLLDVSEVDIQNDNKKHTAKEITKISKKLAELTENYDTCRVLTYGAKIVLAGKTNSGKSTLFNVLVGENRSIISKSPGTTRDYIDARISLSGVPILLIDTAGIRQSNDSIEALGVEKSKELIKDADLVCYMTDITDNNSSEVPDNIELMDDKIIYIYNKVDLINLKEKRKAGDKSIYISALNKTGISKIKSSILKKLNVDNVPDKLVGVSTPRQFQCINSCLVSLKNVSDILSVGFELELICFELNEALESINDLLGENTEETVLNNMFDSYCVGK